MKLLSCIGIDIGDYRVKVCLVKKGRVQAFFMEPLPDNIVRGGVIAAWDALSDFLRELLKRHKISCRSCFIAVPTELCYLRRMQLPMMTTSQLELNLPYEFHDYISEEPSEYYYDYSVTSRSMEGLGLQAAAMKREIIQLYRSMTKRAGLKLVGLIPKPLCFQRIIRHYNELCGIAMEKDYALLDIGERAIRIHFFSSGYYETTRTLDGGGSLYVDRVSAISGSDTHMGRIRMESNQDNILSHEEIRELYANDAVQIMRVLNFYSFNNPENSIDALYYCGGGVHAEGLLAAISEQVSLPLRGLSELMEDAGEYSAAISEGAEAYGITLPLDRAGSIRDIDWQEGEL